MYIHRVRSIRNGKVYESVLLQESVRTPKGPRARTILHLNRLPPELQAAIIAAVEGKEMVSLPDLAVSPAADCGGLAVLRDAWDRLAAERLFAPIPGERQRKLLRAMVFSRILSPRSQPALREQAAQCLLACSCGLEPDETFSEEDLHAAMAALDGRWSRIERELYRQAAPGGVSLVLYDLTRIDFDDDALMDDYGSAYRGERRSVLLAVAIDPEGVPVHGEVLRGSRSDSATLTGLLVSLRRRLGIREAAFVFPAGLKGRWNPKRLRGRKLPYVTRASRGKLQELLKGRPQDARPEPAEKTRLWAMERDGVRYVIAGGKEQASRDADRRRRRIARGERELTALAAALPENLNVVDLGRRVRPALERLKAHQYFLYGIDEKGSFFWKRNEEAIREEASLDGWSLLLETNLPAETAAPETVLRHHQGLVFLESAFSDFKSSLAGLPLRDWQPDRIRSRVRICFLACWMTAKISQEWKKLGVTEEVHRLLSELQQIRVSTVYAAGKALRKPLVYIPNRLESRIDRLGIRPLFRDLPAWARA